MQAKIIKLVGLKNGGRLSPINLVTFAGTQNGEYGKYPIFHAFQFNRKTLILRYYFPLRNSFSQEFKIHSTRAHSFGETFTKESSKTL